MNSKTEMAVLVCSAAWLSGCGGSGGGGGGNMPTPNPTPELSTGPAVCAAGVAGDFSCAGISLRSRVPYSIMGGTFGNDVWGWVDAQTGREYALIGMTNGTGFVDITDPDAATFVGRLPTETVSSAWRDIKVYADHAYVVADNAGAHGMQVFDLTRLRGVTTPATFDVDAVYTAFRNAHNLAIDTATGFAYAVGTDTCGGGLHFVDLSVPKEPTAAGCYSASDTHDTQCVVYAGPDAAYANREICISSNENHVEIVDVTDKAAPSSVDAFAYLQLGFTHQGWLTEDHRYFVLGDELDELSFGLRTRTHLFDVSDLDAAIYLGAYEAETSAIDHNLYVLGNRIFEANYAAGLRVLEFADLATQNPVEVAHFDTFPDSEAAIFNGAWSVYPYFPSGNVVVSDISNGLFVLRMDGL